MRGRKRKLSEADLDSLEQMYEDEGFEVRRLPWPAVVNEAGINTDASPRIIS